MKIVSIQMYQENLVSFYHKKNISTITKINFVSKGVGLQISRYVNEELWLFTSTPTQLCVYRAAF